MTLSIALWIVLAATTFWCVGVYNRLTRMRARYMDALSSVQKHVARLLGLVRTLDLGNQSALQSISDGDASVSVIPILQSAEYVEAALQACGSTLVATGPAEELSKALTSLASHWHKWAEAPADLAGPLIPDDLRIQWELALQRVELSRGGLNQLITKYNEAINQYPARLLARVVGFRAAGTIRAI